MVPADSTEVSRDSVYSGASREVRSFRVRGYHPLWPAFPRRSANLNSSHVKGPTTPQGKPPRFGLFRLRSPLLTESIFLSFPLGTEMFQFSRLAASYLWIQYELIRESRDQRAFVHYPRLITDFHALHRLLMPRHPPCALSSLTTFIQSSHPKAQHLRTQFPDKHRGYQSNW